MKPPDASDKNTFVAVDFGTKLWVSEDGVAGHVQVAREPGKRAETTRVAQDFVGLVERYFQRGYDVVTEAPTMGSFRNRGRVCEMEALLAAYEGRTLWVVNSHAARNDCRRRGIGTSGPLVDAEAAAAIWRVMEYGGAKRWGPPDEELRPFRYDPLRPHLHGFIQLRNDGYPPTAMDEQVFRFLPAFSALDNHQKLVVGGRDGYLPDRSAALVFALREPASQTREGFERVIGAHRDARPSAYRQVLVVGKSRKDYVHKYHFSGLTFRDWRSATRRLRTDLLPGITYPAKAGISAPGRRERPAGIVFPVLAGIRSPAGRQQLLPGF